MKPLLMKEKIGKEDIHLYSLYKIYLKTRAFVKRFSARFDETPDFGFLERRKTEASSFSRSLRQRSHPKPFWHTHIPHTTGNGGGGHDFKCVVNWFAGAGADCSAQDVDGLVVHIE